MRRDIKKRRNWGIPFKTRSQSHTEYFLEFSLNKIRTKTYSVTIGSVRRKIDRLLHLPRLTVRPWKIEEISPHEADSTSSAYLLHLIWSPLKWVPSIKKNSEKKAKHCSLRNARNDFNNRATVVQNFYIECARREVREKILQVPMFFNKALPLATLTGIACCFDDIPQASLFLCCELQILFAFKISSLLSICSDDTLLNFFVERRSNVSPSVY